jgi:hypothetical protein
MPALAITTLHVVLAIHIMAVVMTFGVTFAYPIVFAVGARLDPRSLPLLHRIEVAIERRLVNPGLVIVLGAGIYLASEDHHWKDFFVQWGLGAVIVIGGIVGAFMIPRSKRAAELAERDLTASATPREGGGPPAVALSEEYRAITRQLALVGSLLSVLVLVTIFFMTTQLGG